MSAHLSDEAVVDIAMGGASGIAARAHVDSCPACARRVREALEALALTRRAEVPEPAPFYWDSLRHGVRQRIALEKTRAAHPPLLVPLLAAAALVAALVSLPASKPGDVAPSPLAAWSALPLAEDDEALQVLEGLALAGGELAALDEARGLDEYLASLSDEESKVLAETLRVRGLGGES